MKGSIISQHENPVKGVLINKNVMIIGSYVCWTNFLGDDTH